MGLLKTVLCRIEANIYCGSMVNLRGPTSSIAKFFFLDIMISLRLQESGFQLKIHFCKE